MFNLFPQKRKGRGFGALFIKALELDKIHLN